MEALSDMLANGDMGSDVLLGLEIQQEAKAMADEWRVVIEECEPTQSQDDLIVIDRAFIHGYYVANVSDPTGQVGGAVDVYIINDVSSKNLKRVSNFQVGDHVIFGPGLGRIDDVLDNVKVMFDDGLVCKVLKADPSRLKPVGKNLLEDAHTRLVLPSSKSQSEFFICFQELNMGVWIMESFKIGTVIVKAGQSDMSSYGF
ncbi:hypothetical protein L2E82_33412 [Cichorium intybus]|uniref:Uncharacterized protein n=1 Tax=Cichorium intybus TaxID=13427 RepID=A0ACB9BK28_CICIN|nr:hypothetical protein L2E82_33412 [Cichorium intybus]